VTGFVGVHPRDDTALVEAETGVRVSHGELADRVASAALALAAAEDGPELAFLALQPDADAVVLYLACLEAGLPVCLLDPRAEPPEGLVRTYAPGWLLLPESAGAPAGCRDSGLWFGSFRAWRATDATRALHPDLALLLSTSGSTGSPKLVRLSKRNLLANARSIAGYLQLGPRERAIGSLPLHYAYGLSVLNSHLVAGGTVVLTTHSFIRPEFWACFDREGCTSFAGVPYVYETLHRLRFDPARHASLRTLTQAGGPLRRELVEHWHAATGRAGSRFVVMYGQTEATARIAYVPPGELGRKPGSIGIAIPGGTLSLASVEGHDELELVYEGPNVMMGYAESAADLALGDVCNGRLRTGDLGRVDDEGYHYVTGRLARFAKLFGSRVSLEDVERDLESHFPVRAAATDGGDRLVVHVESDATVATGDLVRHVAAWLGVPPGAITVTLVAALPRTPTGKKDYRALEVTS
jgi:acyl-CoA synthetase (AMP-forming)/AMP-acid ligase II